MRAGLDHVHLFASDVARTTECFRTLFGASVVRHVMVAGPDDLLIELHECREPVRRGIER